MKRSFIVSWLATSIILIGTCCYSHCEIPCGIYNDKMRIALLKEHVGTIEKSAKQVVKLSAAQEKNYNQIVRWINNKEEHACKIQKIVTQYFMTQRIKIVSDKKSQKQVKYLRELSLLHEILVYSMKAKQSTAPENAKKLRELISAFEKSYFGN